MPTPWTAQTGDLQRRGPGDPAWVKALFVAPAVVGSFCALVVLGRTAAARQGWRRWAGRGRPPRVADGAGRAASVEALRASVVGLAKPQVLALFGPPPAAAGGAVSTWYYPLHKAERLVLAVQFDHDHARVVEVFTAPA